MAYKYNPFINNFDDVGTAGGGGGTPGGSNTQIQFNDSSAFGGDADLTWNKTTNVLGVTGDVNLSDGGTYTTTLQTITPTADRTISLPDATGTVALVAGSSGQVLWNNAGVNAGASTLTYDGSILTTSGRFINSYNATASSPAKAFTGTWFTGGTGTTTKPQVLIEPTGATSTAWSTSGTGLGVNAASGFAGNLLDLQVNGTSQASITSVGQLNVRTGFYNNPGIRFASGDYIYAGNNSFNFYATNGYAGGFSRGSGGPAVVIGTSTIFEENSSTVLAQRNSTNAQAFRWYQTYTDASNYSRVGLDVGLTTSNVFTFGPQAAGTGTLRPLYLSTGSTTVANLASASAVGAGARAFVTDANATTFLSTVAGGGANKVPVVSDGTNWLIG